MATEIKQCSTSVRYRADEATRNADLKAVVRGLVDGWAAASDDALEVVVIQGGITNLLYRVDFEDAPEGAVKSALCRVFGAKTELLINREKDNLVFQQLSDLEFGPFMHGAFGNGRVEGWVTAGPLEPPQMAETSPVDLQGLIAAGLARMHTLDMPGSRTAMLWEFLEKWYDMTDVTFDDDEAKAGRLAALNREELKAEMEWLKTVLPSPANNNGLDFASAAADDAAKRAHDICNTVAFCHNDLLSGNILKLKDADSIQIVDFEYGGFNFVGFDLANHFCEYAGFDFDLDRWYPNETAQTRFFEKYLEVANPEALSGLEDTDKAAVLRALYQRVNQFALASHFFWGLWAIIQARHSPIDFDFMTYALDRFGGYYKHKAAFFADAATAANSAAGARIMGAKPTAAEAGGEEEEEEEEEEEAKGSEGGGDGPTTTTKALVVTDEAAPKGSGCPIHNPKLWLGVGVAALVLGALVIRRRMR